MSGMRDDVRHAMSEPLLSRGGFFAAPPRRGTEEEEIARKFTNKARGADIQTTCINLLKNMVGAGLLNVCIAFKYASVVGGLINMLISCFLCTCGFLLIGYLCSKTGATTFKTLMVVSIGEKAGVAMDVILFFHTLFSCVGYVTLIGDFTTKSMSGLLPGSIFAESRTVSIITITVIILFPLALLRDLSSLKFTSAAGLLVTSLACMYVFSDCLLHAGEYHALENLQENWFYINLDTFKCIALFNGSFSAHYNAPTYYAELKEKSFDNYAKAALISFAIATALFTTFGLCGFARFGPYVMGNILKGYSADSTMVQLCWMCMMMSTVFVFPLSFQRMRSSWTALVNKPGKIHARSSIPLTTIGLLAVCVYFGTAFDDIAVIKMIKGATLGVSIMFIMPGWAYLSVCDKPEFRNQSSSSKFEAMVPPKFLKAFSRALIFVGVWQGLLALLVHYEFI
jgi:amino acid permease